MPDAPLSPMVQEHERKILALEIKVGYLEIDLQRQKDELAVYQASAVSANKKMDAVLSALVGDATTKTTGLMQRIESIETVTNAIKELRWKVVGGLVVIGWAWASGSWILEKLLK